MKPAIIPTSQIKVGTRMREDLGDVQGLAASIKELGLIQPIVLDTNFNLIDGGRRYHAVTQILKLEEIAIVIKDCEDEATLRIMELEANIRAKQMDWREKVKCVCEVHRLHVIRTSRLGESWTQKLTGHLLNMATGDVSLCLKMGLVLKDPKHACNKAESLQDAYRYLLEIKEDEVNRINSTFQQELIKSNVSIPGIIDVPVVPVKPEHSSKLSIDAAIVRTPEQITKEPIIQEQVAKKTMTIVLSDYFNHGDCLAHMDSLKPESVDHIVTDPPFGIDMENLENTERVEEEHQVDANIKLLQDFFPRAYRVLRDKSFCVVWYDFQYHGWIVDVAEDAGFTVCRWPLVWVKTHKCANQAAAYNYTKATEVALVCRKGNATLNSAQGTNYWIGSNDDDRAKYNHKFVKPKGLWSWIFRAIAQKSQIVYDPFMGRGSSVFAAVEMGLYPKGCEIKDIHYHGFIADFKTLMTTWYGEQFNLVFK